MLDQLRGRNLAHVGCTIGLTLGLIVGLIVAFLIVLLVQTDSAASVGAFVWLAIIAALGALGYYVGSRTSRRLWGEKERSEP